MFFNVLLISTAIITQSPQQPDNTIPPNESFQCSPEIVLDFSPAPWSVCLNRFDPVEADSCVDLLIEIPQLSGISLHFVRTDTTGWRYSGIIDTDSSGTPIDLRIDLAKTPEGDLLHAVFHPEITKNMTVSTNMLVHQNDRPARPDTIPSFTMHLRRTTRLCHPPVRYIVENRIFTYPPGYRRDPVYNCAERSMFHSGMSVRMPTAGSLEKRAQEYLYWHCMTLSPLTFENPEELVKNEALKNRFTRKKRIRKEKKPGKSRFRLQPLR
ncbi:MAG: hypothetical protein JW863_01345 [Chitinispirillaceae bacterium]|nr:hypothetical protein [Chitinispirillaceae bacterium]